MASIAQTAPARGTASIHPDIDSVLASQPAAVAHSAARAIAAALETRLAADGDEGFRGSRLTGDGFPVEFATSSADARLRLTVEPGPRARSPLARTALCAELAGDLGGAMLDADRLERLYRAQAEGPLTYGGWLGCRIDLAGDVATKLYAELPEQGSPPFCADLLPSLGAREIAMRMAACSADGAEELYVRVPSLLPGEVAAVLAPAGLEAEAEALLDWLAHAYGHGFDGRLPGQSVGVSYARKGGDVVVTLFFYARALWGSDARIRRNFAAHAGPSRQLDAYHAATYPFATREDWRTYHGLVGITPLAGAPPRLVVGYRPVAAR